MFKFTKLKEWCLTGTRPAFYDTESATAIEQTAKLYGAIKTLIDETEKAINELNQTVIDYKNGVIENFECFKAQITKITHDYVAMIDEKIKLQDVKINESIVFIKDNLEVSVKTILEDMSANGELDSIILSSLSSIESSIESVNSELDSMKNTYDNQINILINDVSELKAKSNVIYNENSESLIIGGEI